MRCAASWATRESIPSYRPQANTRCARVGVPSGGRLGERHAARGRHDQQRPARRPPATSASSAWPHGSGRMTMPGPPPYGESSTVRWTSSVQARRSWTPTSSSPLVRALPSSEASSGARYSGKIVTTSMRTRTPTARATPAAGRRRRDRPSRSTSGTIDATNGTRISRALGRAQREQHRRRQVHDVGDLAEHGAVDVDCRAARSAGGRRTRPGRRSPSSSEASTDSRMPRSSSAALRSGDARELHEQPAVVRPGALDDHGRAAPGGRW